MFWVPQKGGENFSLLHLVLQTQRIREKTRKKNNASSINYEIVSNTSIILQWNFTI